MKKLGSIGLGNFCKALLEHKNINIYTKDIDVLYHFRWNGKLYKDKKGYLDLDYTVTEIINIFLEGIYSLDYTWELVE